MDHNKYMTTGEFARRMGVTKNTLFHYDNIGLFLPEIVDTNDYRYYSIYQMEVFDTIIILKEMGMPLNEIKEFMDHRSPESLMELFEKEDKRKILTVFPTADYMVCSIECSLVQKEAIRQELRLAMQERFHYHYAVAGLPFILWNIPFYQENHYTCSSYVARVLEEYGVCHWEKHFSLVTPKDFMEKFGRKRIFEGSLRELVEMSVQEETVCAVEKIA